MAKKTKHDAVGSESLVQVVGRAFDFAGAIRKVMGGAKVARYTRQPAFGFVFGGRITSLDAPGVQLPARIITAPCLFRCDEHGVVHAGWQPTAEDMLAHDWLELVGRAT